MKKIISRYMLEEALLKSSEINIAIAKENHKLWNRIRKQDRILRVILKKEPEKEAKK